MIEILPSWHPVFVHFTLGLLLIATALYISSLILPASSPRRGELLLVANWNLWMGYAFALITAWFGWRAFNTVVHDDISHLAMTEHRNWALTTLTVYLPVVLWSIFRARAAKQPDWIFATILLIPTALLVSTGWHGAEVVYRYGLGVMSLPVRAAHTHSGDGHVHNHSHSHEHTLPAK